MSHRIRPRFEKVGGLLGVRGWDLEKEGKKDGKMERWKERKKERKKEREEDGSFLSIWGGNGVVGSGCVYSGVRN